MAKNDELPPMGLPTAPPSSSGYFFGIITMVILCGAVVLAIGYGSITLQSGPCDELYGEALGGLEAEVDFFRKSGSDVGVSRVEIQELRASTQVAGDSLEACCEQQQEGTISEERFRECRQHASAMAAIPAELAATHSDPVLAKKTIRSAASRLRGIAADLNDVANRR